MHICHTFSSQHCWFVHLSNHIYLVWFILHDHDQSITFPNNVLDLTMRLRSLFHVKLNHGWTIHLVLSSLTTSMCKVECHQRGIYLGGSKPSLKLVSFTASSASSSHVHPPVGHLGAFQEPLCFRLGHNEQGESLHCSPARVHSH